MEAILEATARVLVKEGYDHTSTNKIAKTAGVSVGSLYQYFPNKEAVVAALIERHFEEQANVLQKHLGEVHTLPIPDAVRLVVTGIIEAKRINPKLHRVLREQVPRLGRLDRILDLGARMEDLILTQLRSRADELRLKDLDVAAHVLVYAVDGITHAAILEPHHSIQDDRLIDAMTDLVLRYLIP